MQVPVLPFWWIKIDSALSEYIEYMNSVQHFPVFVSLSLSRIGAWKLVNQLHQKSRR